MSPPNTISVFDSLTWKNPEVQYKIPANKSLTENPKYYVPDRLQVWEDFNFETLKELKLLDLIRVDTTGLSGPPCLGLGELIVKAEPQTVHILTKWSHSIVQAGLDAMASKIPTCTWNAAITEEDRASKTHQSTPAYTESSPSCPPTPLRKGQSTSMGGPREPRFNPDGGATAICRTHGISCPASEVELLPKDYKAFTKWKSEDVLGSLVNKDGTWKRGAKKDPKTSPIRQAFTYSVKYGCRYGCVLTTEEAFLFRVRPDSKPGPSTKPLRAVLKKKACLEYVVVPWSTNEGHPQEDNNDTDSPSSGLTFNLALWFIHVLAAAEHSIQWEYGKLSDLNMTIRECDAMKTPITPDSHFQSSTRKRKATNTSTNPREYSSDSSTEQINYSFRSESSLFGPKLQSPRGVSVSSNSTMHIAESPVRVPTTRFAVGEQRRMAVSNQDTERETEKELRRSKRVRARCDGL